MIDDDDDDLLFFPSAGPAAVNSRGGRTKLTAGARWWCPPAIEDLLDQADHFLVLGAIDPTAG